MADTITKTCRVCEEDFDSIPRIDKGICDECQEKAERQDNITCPFCGEVNEDSFEIESGEYTCYGCGEKLYVEKEVDVSYSARPLN